MNYPVWEIFTGGGGFPIALMAIIHVFVAHFAVGGGMFLVFTEYRAYRDNSDKTLEFVKKHTVFFLLLSTVFGNITGVGIWFTISLVSPAATSLLVHDFVFAWAAEWVFFAVELVAVLVYYYSFGKVDRKTHLTIGAIYFIASWLSLATINGIVAFMLTPGTWIVTGNFWEGLFNPTYLPSLMVRTFLSFVLAGIFGFVSAVMIRETEFRLRMVRYCSLWLILPYLLMVASAVWYYKALPAEARAMILGASPELPGMVRSLLFLTPLVFAGGLAMTARMPLKATRLTAAVVMLLGLLHLGAFEWVREATRRPWLVSDHIYSNAIFAGELGEIRRKGILASARWVENRKITDENRMAAGKELFKLQCLSCHALGGPMNDIRKITENYTEAGLDAHLTGMGKINKYMPPFAGNAAERRALAHYLTAGLHGKTKGSPQEPPPAVEPPPFGAEDSPYVLLAWNSMGTKMFSDADETFSILPPGNDIHAQLIRRGEFPEIVTDEVKLRYRMENGYENPSGRTKFWQFADSLLGKELEKNTGLTGNGTRGAMILDEERNLFTATRVPVVPYADSPPFNPYPVVHVEAVEAETGLVIARTTTAAPASTEMGCRNCHGGEWKAAGAAGMSAETAQNVASVHDKRNGTDLMARAGLGKPAACASCHADASDGRPGDGTLPGLSTAIHGHHAKFLSGSGADSCNLCHPSDPMGSTRFFRGRHAEMFECTECHGSLVDHALSLAKGEAEAGRTDEGRAFARSLIDKLRPQGSPDVKPRKAWIEEPDCLGCHGDYDISEVEAYEPYRTWEKNLYRERRDEMDAIMCAGCHGAPHAVHPSESSPAGNRDALQPLQYQDNDDTLGKENCSVCHTVEMEEDGHHPNQL